MLCDAGHAQDGLSAFAGGGHTSARLPEASSPEGGLMPKHPRVLLASIAAAAVAITSVAVPAATSASPATHSAPAAASNRGTLVSHVYGTFGNGGTVRGTFMPER